MRRFFVPGELSPGSAVLLPADILHHLRVLRLAPGDRIELLDGRGGVATGRISELSRHSATVLIEGFRQQQADKLELQLLQGIPKGSKMDLVLQKGTELGITRFTPVFCRNGDVQLPHERLAARTERWQKIVQEAARQCRRERLPQVDSPLPLSEALAACTGTLRLLPWEMEARPLRTALEGAASTSIAVLIGPEGGFTAEEASRAETAGFLPVSLGQRILRSETAGLAVASILQYLFGDLGSGRSDLQIDATSVSTPN